MRTVAAYAAVAHAGQTAGTEFDVLIDHVDRLDLVTVRRRYAFQKGAGDVQRVSFCDSQFFVCRIDLTPAGRAPADSGTLPDQYKQDLRP